MEDEPYNLAEHVCSEKDQGYAHATCIVCSSPIKCPWWDKLVHVAQLINELM